jgi:phospholipid:diacylglycerol acyltransferase
MTLIHRAKTWSDPDSANAATIEQTQDSTKLVELETHVLEELKRKQKPSSARSASKSLWTSRRLLFSLGLCLGAGIGLWFVQPDDIQGMQAQVALFVNEFGVKLPDWDFSRFEEEWIRVRSSIPEFWKFNNDGREFLVGQSMKDRGLTANFPVVLIPGVISTGLESWTTKPEYRPFFREKVWGSLGMIQQVTFNKERWISMMMLDPITGLDPPDIKVRAAEGIEAASSFIQGFWIWFAPTYSDKSTLTNCVPFAGRK